MPIEGAVLFELDLNNTSPAIVPIEGAVLFELDLNTDHLYGTLSANIKLMQLKWSNVELPAL